MIDISTHKNIGLYTDYRQCLSFLRGIDEASYSYPQGITNIHLYSEVTKRKELLAVESYFATQSVEHTKLILWSDWNISDNPLLAAFRERIDFRVFDPVSEADGTPLEGKKKVLLAEDSKHYMKSGLLRFLALYKYGGIWMDMDMVLLRNLVPILDQEFAYVWERKHTDFEKDGPCAAFMGIKKGSEHATICIEELANAPIIPNSVSRDCDMLAKVYNRRPFTVFPAAFFNAEWQIPSKAGEGLRDGWFIKTETSNQLFPESFAWHWHGSGGNRNVEVIENGSKFDLISKRTKAKIKPSISFIFAARNDQYGNNLGIFPVPHVKDMNLERIAAVLRMHHYMGIPGSEVILLDCFPVEGQPKLRDLFADYARVIEIPTTVRDILYKQVTWRMPIYEFLCKHVGALISNSDNLFFHNSDDLFRRDGIKEAMNQIKAGYVVRADRVGVHPDVVTNDARLRELVDDTSPRGIPGYNRFPGAGGDYFGIRRDIYFKTGGWRVAHGEWDLDAEYLRRLEKHNILRIQEDTFYHMEHYSAEAPQHKNTPNRPPRIEGENHPLIEELPKILEMISSHNNVEYCPV